MLLQSMQEYAAAAGVQAPALPPGERFAQALTALRRQCELDLSRPEFQAAGLGLADFLPALLALAQEIHFLKYDPWDPTIRIKSFPPSRVVYQYNPFRDPRNRQASGQQAAAAPGERPDFLAWETFPDNEHYFIWTTPGGRRYGVLVQPVPIVPGHLILASLDHDPRTGRHYEQVMETVHLESMHALQEQLADLDYVLGFNDRGAGASVDHFHTQAVPRQYLPFVRACDARKLALSTMHGSPGGARLSVVTGPADFPSYPADCLLLQGEHNADLWPWEQTVVQVMREQDVRFNSLSWRQTDGAYAEAFFPRSQETVLSGQLKAGYVEMAGMLVLPEEEIFAGIQGPETGEEALKQACLELSQRWDLFEKIIARIAKT